MIVNLGIYGIVRVNLDLAPVSGVVPGLIVLAIGSISALVGMGARKRRDTYRGYNGYVLERNNRRILSAAIPR